MLVIYLTFGKEDSLYLFIKEVQNLFRNVSRIDIIIALLSCFYKLFEKKKRIPDWINTSFFTIPKGFTKSLSCVTTSFALTESVWNALEQHFTVFSVFLDITWLSIHSGIQVSFKLKALEIKGQLLKTFDNVILRCKVQLYSSSSFDLL